VPQHRPRSLDKLSSDRLRPSTAVTVSAGRKTKRARLRFAAKPNSARVYPTPQPPSPTSTVSAANGSAGASAQTTTTLHYLQNSTAINITSVTQFWSRRQSRHPCNSRNSHLENSRTALATRPFIISHHTHTVLAIILVSTLITSQIPSICTRNRSRTRRNIYTYISISIY